MSARGPTASGWPARAPTPEDVKTCCATAYQHDAVALILGESYHPGGLALTRRLAGSLDLRVRERVADVASGPGATAFLLAGEYGVSVEGIDLGATAVAAANAKAAQAGVSDRVVFRVGDAEQLPLDDASVDAVVCECALCTFPNKEVATAEIARVLKPRGRVGITDVTLDRDRLDSKLTSLAGWVACMADARPAADYCRYLQRAGLEITLVEAHDYALARMTEMIDARLVAFQMVGAPALAGIDVELVRDNVAVAARAVADGIAGYSLLVAHKPAT
jgi:ubiquinone/menaquinone biosynthesis C-methylase UbiE